MTDFDLRERRFGCMEDGDNIWYNNEAVKDDIKLREEIIELRSWWREQGYCLQYYWSRIIYTSIECNMEIGKK